MWMLLVDIFTAGPLGPNPQLFAAGVGVFLAGWGLTRVEIRGVNLLTAFRRHCYSFPVRSPTT